MNVTFYELPCCHAARCSEQNWVDQEVERQQLGLLPSVPPHSEHRHRFAVCVLREEETAAVGAPVWGLVLTQSSAVMHGEVKNSTRLVRFQLSWHPEQLQSRTGWG